MFERAALEDAEEDGVEPEVSMVHSPFNELDGRSKMSTGQMLPFSGISQPDAPEAAEVDLLNHESGRFWVQLAAESTIFPAAKL